MAYKQNVSAEASEEAMGRVRTGYPWITIPGGTPPAWKTTRLRMLPPPDTHPDDTYFFWAAVHGNLPGSKFPVLCPAKMYNQPCPACDLGNELWNSGKKTEAYKYFASWRALVNVVILNKDGSTPDDVKVGLWGVPRSTFEDLDAKIKELPKNERNITDPMEGRDIIVRRKGSKVEDTKYEIAPADTSTALSDEVMDLLLEDGKLVELHTVYKPTTTQQVKLLLAAPSTEGEETPRRRALPQGDTFFDDEEEDENTVEGTYTVVVEEDEEEEAPPPPPKRGAAKSEAEQAAQAKLLAKLEEIKKKAAQPATAPSDDDEEEEDED